MDQLPHVGIPSRGLAVLLSVGTVIVETIEDFPMGRPPFVGKSSRLRMSQKPEDITKILTSTKPEKIYLVFECFTNSQRFT
ncbi:hypothetical protein CPB83DRAFT_861264 [Crepidotus variabilis]|uniref:Uncharacterized protein n=1 Tax=Crepidotus variabilis TaxID=179855 RepID=A0A9P6E8P9_9AGAR|nr:hypothetical protein CPB83DRAFT_863279 [Crepidotus variabilis]KAF9524502.1 hypothetical protein CPB83DRAFT_861264 [Crepidotus variabilis]